MLKLYHGTTSVCSQKARLGLAEKGLEWESQIIDIRKGEQFDPAYMKLNPNAVVPTLDHDGKIVIESSVIIDYLNETFPEKPLMPEDTHKRALIRIWLLRGLEVHASINTMSFSTAYRERELAKSPEEREKGYAQIPNRAKAAKKRDLTENGVKSFYVDTAVDHLSRVFYDMDAGLTEGDWVVAGQFSLADICLIPYVDRLYRLGLEGFWGDYPRVNAWYERWRARPTWQEQVAAYHDPAATEKSRKAGGQYWPEIASRMKAVAA